MTNENEEQIVNGNDYMKTECFLSGSALAHPPPGEEIVISGLAGIFPDSRNAREFRDNLFNKVDMVSCDSRRWDPTHPEIPQRTGKLYDIDKFDAGFFGIHSRQGEASDPVCRLFLERTIEAIFDAGINPKELEGTNTGVFVGSCFSESEKTWFFDNLKSQQFAVTGTERSMISQRVSYYLKLKGPSFIADTACSSSLYCLEQAYKSMRSGHCDVAIVGGCNVCLHPFVSLQFARLGVLSQDGTCKVFDADGNGYARSEAVAAVILQKSKDSRRIYCEVVHAKTNCDGFKPQSITYPSGDAQKLLLQEFYQECDIDPSSLSFLEAHGTGTTVGDPEELQAIDEVFCKGRKTPLLVGSVKSNIGHSEPSSGLCSIAKAIFGMEHELIPPNLHYNKPREGVEALEKGRLKVVTEKTPFEDDRGLIGVNSFGFGGGNAHILLRWNQKKKVNGGTPRDDLPRLICVSGRIKESVDVIFNDLASRELDAEHIRLYHQIFSKNIPGHLHRGYQILSKSGEIKRSSAFHDDTPKPIYLAFTTFYSSWSLIANEFLSVPLFMGTLHRIHNILTPKLVNVTELIRNDKKGERNSICSDILGTMIIQIAFVDIFKALNIKPEGYFGIGLGEFVCGYLEGCLTLEETVLAVYNVASQFENFTKAKPKILGTLKKIIPNSRTKSESWITPSNGTSASADYFLSIITKSFSCDDLKIKQDSTIIEIGKGVLSPSAKITHLSFREAGLKNSFVTLIEILGHIYELGHSFPVDELYPPVPYPVSRGTPMISPLIKWDHSRSWFVTFYEHSGTMKSGERSVSLSIKDDDWVFLSGHVIDGRNLFPATGYLMLAWEALSYLTGVMISDMQVVFENCKFLRVTNLSKDMKTEMTVMVQRGSGNFEVIESESCIVKGRISLFRKDKEESIDLPLPLGVSPRKALPLKMKDIYKELRLRGYNYSGPFRKLKECDNSATVGKIHWDGNWITFMDNMLQMKILQIDTRFLYVPTSIKRLTIDAKEHIAYAQTFGEEADLPVYVYKDCDIIRSGAIEIRGLSASSINRRKTRGAPVLEKYEFVPNEAKLSLCDSVRVMVQVILENLPSYKVKAVELIDEATREDAEPLATLIHQVLGDLPLIQAMITVLSKKEMELPNITVEDKKLVAETDCTVVIGSSLLSRVMTLNQAFGAVKENAFVISRESPDYEPKSSTLDGIDVLLVHKTDNEKLFMLRKNFETKSPTVIDITETTDEFSWLPSLQKAIKNDPNVIVLAQNQPLSGVLGLVNCIRREPSCGHVKTVFTFEGAPLFDLTHPFYDEQLKKNLVINVFKNGQWGTYRHLLLGNQQEVEREHCFCNALVRGDFSSLKWLEGSLTHKTVIPPEKELVYIYYCALNFRDIMTASGRISADVITRDRTQQEFIHGFEFSGKTQKGRRVMGIASGALTTLLMADRYLLWPVPDHWSLEEAATVPVVYSTILFAFFVECHIRKGQSILIHAGSGGVGQAAISVCLHYGLTVYTTVGTPEKREFLKKRFPQLTDKHIGNSRDTSFEQMIVSRTNGEGVDYVLNSLAEEKLLASVRCLKRGGNFLEIGKFDLASNNSLHLALIERDCCFHGIMVDAVFSLDPTAKLNIRHLMIEGILNGAIRPLIRTIFKMAEVEQAFRYMAGGKHIGKVIIQIRKEEINRNTVPKPSLYKGLPRYSCDPEKVYVIVGGLGGFGLELADWLVVRGARKLVLTSRKGIQTGYQSFRVKTWIAYGTEIHISTADVTTMVGCEQLIREALKHGPVESVYNLAVVLKDGILENQTEDNFKQSLAPKAFATMYLDEVTRNLCPELKDFVIFSSVSCGRGNAGQTNYGMANSVMERICEKRKLDGLPALAIEWGAVGDVGLVAEMQEEHTELEIGGTLQQRISSCLQVLDIFFKQPNVIVSSMVVAEKRLGAAGADNIVDAVANILGLGDLKKISLHASLAELGMDSMTAVEIKQTLEREYEVFLTPQDIRGMTFSKLMEIQEERASEDESAKKDRALGGFEMIVRLMNNEEASKIPLVKLKTKINDDVVAPRVIFFPGIEGVAKVLESLAHNLNVHIDCLQFPYEIPQETIPEMAESVLPVVETLISKTEPFYIIAYSYGAVIALEVLSLLEEKGYVGTLISLDGAPEMLGQLLKNSLNISSEAFFQTGFLTQLMSLYMPLEIILKHKDKFIMAANFEDRLKVAEQIVPKDTPHSHRYLRVFATSLYKRLKALGQYEPCFNKLKSTVKLYKPHNVSLTGLDEDYKLSELCENPVEVIVFRGNHVTLLDNLELAETINNVIGVASVSEKETIDKEITENEVIEKEAILSDGATKVQSSEIEVKQI